MRDNDGCEMTARVPRQTDHGAWSGRENRTHACFGTGARRERSCMCGALRCAVDRYIAMRWIRSHIAHIDGAPQTRGNCLSLALRSMRWLESRVSRTANVQPQPDSGADGRGGPTEDRSIQAMKQTNSVAYVARVAIKAKRCRWGVAGRCFALVSISHLSRETYSERRQFSVSCVCRLVERARPWRFGHGIWRTRVMPPRASPVVGAWPRCGCERLQAASH